VTGLLPLDEVVALDGGLSTALEERGADLSGDRWTARLLTDDPDLLAAAHRAFYLAGARVATTASYQATDPHLLARSVAIASGARDQLVETHAGLLVAASVGPYGAVLADGSEYRGRYGIGRARLRDFHAPRIDVLAAAGADLLAVETLPDQEEAEVVADLLADAGLPAWVSYTVSGDRTAAGQPLAEAYAVLADRPGVAAAGVNCSAQDDVLGAVSAAVAATGLPAVAYPNRGGSWDAGAKRWSYGDAIDLDLLDAWVAAGARWVGGCCGTGPCDIAGLSRRLEQVAGA
jgi:homocysteine S-methyltransferase